MEQETGILAEFSDDEKNKALSSIFNLYFNRNFGATSKSDFETLLFSIYIEHLIDNEQPYDDYTMSKNLGITETRVRALKERKQLKYPREFDWKTSFANLVGNAKYDDVTKTVKLSIEDVNLLKELQYFVRTNGWYYEVQLNSRLFQCKLDCFLMICTELDEITLTESAKKNLHNLAREGDERPAIKKIVDGDLKSGLKDLALKGSMEMLCTVIEYLIGTPLNHAISISLIALNGIAKVIKNEIEETKA